MMNISNNLKKVRFTGAGAGTGAGSPAEKPVETFLQDQTGTLLPFSEKLRTIRTRFESGGGPTAEKLRDAISRLKALLDEDLIYGMGIEPCPGEWDSILSELDYITLSIGNIGVTSREIAEEIEKKQDEMIPPVNLVIKLESLLSDSSKRQ